MSNPYVSEDSVSKLRQVAAGKLDQQNERTPDGKVGMPANGKQWDKVPASQSFRSVRSPNAR